MSAEPTFGVGRGSLTTFQDKPRRGADPIARPRGATPNNLREPGQFGQPARPAPALAARKTMPPLGGRDEQTSSDRAFSAPVAGTAPAQQGPDLSQLLSHNDRQGAAVGPGSNLGSTLGGAPQGSSGLHQAPAPALAPAAMPAAAPAPAMAPEPAAAPAAERNTLHIGSAICIENGNITNCDRLVVEGHIDTRLDGGRLLEITAAGAFTGSAEVDIATVDGEFEGELIVREKLIVTSNGRVSGKIRYAHIEVAPGGVIQGDLGAL